MQIFILTIIKWQQLQLCYCFEITTNLSGFNFRFFCSQFHKNDRNEEYTRKREHIPILKEKKKDMGKVRTMNTNVHDKKGYGEKEKDIDREGNKAGEAGCSEKVKKSFTPATIATATEMREDPQELNKIPSTEGAEDIEWDDT